MHFPEALTKARSVARERHLAMVVVHAPIENMDDEIQWGRGPFSYCPADGVELLFAHALKGMGQKDWPALGIVARVNALGRVTEKQAIPATDNASAARYLNPELVNDSQHR